MSRKFVCLLQCLRLSAVCTAALVVNLPSVIDCLPACPGFCRMSKLSVYMYRQAAKFRSGAGDTRLLTSWHLALLNCKILVFLELLGKKSDNFGFWEGFRRVSKNIQGFTSLYFQTSALLLRRRSQPNCKPLGLLTVYDTAYSTILDSPLIDVPWFQGRLKIYDGLRNSTRKQLATPNRTRTIFCRHPFASHLLPYFSGGGGGDCKNELPNRQVYLLQPPGDFLRQRMFVNWP